MEKMILKSATIGLAMLSSVALFSCSNDDDDNGGAGKPEETVLSGFVTKNMRLTKGKTYTLDGKLQVKAPAVLTIEPGVKIIAKYDDNVDYILIEQGAKIMAQGTAAEPIVMTSEKKEAGAWGGLHICGYAHTNISGGAGKSEIGDAAYGGNNDADNSGVLKYVRLEYTGYAFDAEHESNGVSFYGVGNGTTVSYVQTYRGADDGFEFFGGSVNFDHCVSVDSSDDSFDWTEGWNGKGNYLVAYQAPKEEIGYDCDCLIEADNNGNNFNALPVAHPILSNLTLVGNGGSKHGVRLRAGTQVELSNAQITGKGMALSVETEQTENALKNGVSKLKNIAISGEIASKEGIYTTSDFVAAGNLTNQTFSFTDKFVGMTNGRGAIEASNYWMSGWTK